MNQKMTFESAVARLNEIVEQLERGDAPLEDSLKLFEEGSSLASYCYKKLSAAEQKIKKISELEEGEADGKD
ncbi:MAG TPA: exodeoxyribonuclease VII small subunit [Caproicibacter sp.]|nr:exodeoxyribonuclease VII small subunit [Caproicibacter sp.]